MGRRPCASVLGCLCGGVCLCRVCVPVRVTTVTVHPSCELSFNTKDETMSVTVKLRERDSGRLGFPLQGQSKGGQGLPVGLPALGRGGRVPGAIPQACRCPALASAAPGQAHGQVAHHHLYPQFSCGKESPSASFLWTLGPLSGGCLPAVGAGPAVGHSKPCSHRRSIQSPGVAKSGLRQLCSGAEAVISGPENF